MHAKYLIETLIEAFESYYVLNDAAHDLHHHQQVLAYALKIGESEDADLELLIPMALGHDVVCYPKNSPQAHLSTIHSAELTAKTLANIPGYPAEKIPAVAQAIKICSFSKGIPAETLEEGILKDADLLEATGARAIMRTFYSSGHMGKALMSPEDPFCENRDPEAFKYGLDLFKERLLVVMNYMHTDLAKKLAAEDHHMLIGFMKNLSKQHSVYTEMVKNYGLDNPSHEKDTPILWRIAPTMAKAANSA